MFKKVEQLMIDLENWLVQKIDCDPEYDSYKTMEHYMMAVCPNEYALYHVLNNYLNRKAEEAND